MTDLHRWYTRKSMVETSLGFPAKSQEDADTFQALLEQATKDGLGYNRAFYVSEGVETKSADEDGRTALLTASTNDVDRDQEIVLQKGIDVKLYNKNPVVAWSHDLKTQPPIGFAKWAKIIDGSLRAKVKFAERPADYPAGSWFPDTVWNLVSQGIVKGVSIGFIGLEARPPETKEIELNPKWAAARRIITKSMLTEISICGVGCNPNALVESVTKGLCTREDILGLGLELPVEEHKGWTWETSDIVIPIKAPITKDEWIKSLLKTR
jgi:hypothetical protein